MPSSPAASTPAEVATCAACMGVTSVAPLALNDCKPTAVNAPKQSNTMQNCRICIRHTFRLQVRDDDRAQWWPLVHYLIAESRTCKYLKGGCCYHHTELEGVQGVNRDKKEDKQLRSGRVRFSQ